MMNTPQCRKGIYQGRLYCAVIPPREDESVSCERTDRLMLYHTGLTGGHNQDCCQNGTHLFVAPKGVLHAGWVIGEFTE